MSFARSSKKSRKQDRINLNRYGGSAELFLEKRQNCLSEYGACAVVVRLVSSDNHELYKAGLELGHHMLMGGNVDVQQTLYDLVNSADTEQCAALDGTGGNFFSRLRDSIRLAVKEIPERITYMQTQADARLNFAELTGGLAGATIELTRADLEQEFVSLAHPEQVLSFLKSYARAISCRCRICCMSS